MLPFNGIVEGPWVWISRFGGRGRKENTGPPKNGPKRAVFVVVRMLLIRYFFLLGMEGTLPFSRVWT